MRELIRKFAKIHVCLFKTISRKGIDYMEIKNMISSVTINVVPPITYKEALNKYKEFNTNETISKMIAELEAEIEPIANLRFSAMTFDDFTNEEYKAEAMFFKSIEEVIRNDISIKIASQVTGISETALKQACQQGRLINSYKIASNWIVNLNEVIDYWGLDIQI